MPTRTVSRTRRARFDPSLLPSATNAVATSSVVANKWQIDFSNPVQVVSLPTDFLVEGEPPISYVEDTPTRITLTYPALESSRHTAFLLSGEAKRDILHKVRTQTADVPAARIRPLGDLTFLTDRAAAGSDK